MQHRGSGSVLGLLATTVGVLCLRLVDGVCSMPAIRLSVLGLLAHGLGVLCWRPAELVGVCAMPRIRLSVVGLLLGHGVGVLCLRPNQLLEVVGLFWFVLAKVKSVGVGVDQSLLVLDLRLALGVGPSIMLSVLGL